MGSSVWGREIAEVYDATYAALAEPSVVDPIVDLLAQLAGDGAALEFAVGTGRIALPLSARGVPVHGLELSPEMVEQLRGKPGADAVPVTIGDMTTTRLTDSFELVYLVANSIMNVTTQEEQIAVFSNAAAHLVSGGRFVIELIVPQLGRVGPSEMARRRPGTSCAMKIRRALPSEAGSLAALWLRSRAASIPSIPPTVHTDEEVIRWFGEVVLQTHEVWVAENLGEVVALMVLDHEWIDQLYVDPALTRRGIGGALLDHAMRRRPAGLKLWTFQSNVDARRFYEGRGFVAAAMTAGDNEEHAPDVCYEWRPRSTVQPSEAGAPGRCVPTTDGDHARRDVGTPRGDGDSARDQNVAPLSSTPLSSTPPAGLRWARRRSACACGRYRPRRRHGRAA